MIYRYVYYIVIVFTAMIVVVVGLCGVGKSILFGFHFVAWKIKENRLLHNFSSCNEGNYIFICHNYMCIYMFNCISTMIVVPLKSDRYQKLCKVL